MKMRKIALIAGLMIGLSGISTKTESLGEIAARWFLLYGVDGVPTREDVSMLNDMTVVAKTGFTIALGVSGLITTISLLSTLKNVFSEKKENEWQKTKITTGTIATILFGLIAAGCYVGGQGADVLNNWSSNYFKFSAIFGKIKLMS